MSDLCQLADVKAYLGITTDSTDALLGDLITQASAFIESYCSRVFAQASYTDTRNGNGGAQLFLSNGPVTAVASVTVDGVNIPQSTSPTASGYVADDSVVYLRGRDFCRGVQNVVVAYTAGFATIPADVLQACVELVAWKFAKRNRIDKTSETLSTQQTQAYSIADIPPSVATVLKQRAWVVPT